MFGHYLHYCFCFARRREENSMSSFQWLYGVALLCVCHTMVASLLGDGTMPTHPGSSSSSGAKGMPCAEHCPVGRMPAVLQLLENSTNLPLEQQPLVAALPQCESPKRWNELKLSNLGAKQRVGIWRVEVKAKRAFSNCEPVQSCGTDGVCNYIVSQLLSISTHSVGLILGDAWILVQRKCIELPAHCVGWLPLADAAPTEVSVALTNSDGVHVQQRHPLGQVRSVRKFHEWALLELDSPVMDATAGVEKLCIMDYNSATDAFGVRYAVGPASSLCKWLYRETAGTVRCG